MEWLDKLRIAVINEDVEGLSQMAFYEVPKFDNVEDLKLAKSLVDKAAKIVKKEQDRIAHYLYEYRKLKNYNNSYSQNSAMGEWVG